MESIITQALETWNRGGNLAVFALAVAFGIYKGVRAATKGVRWAFGGRQHSPAVESILAYMDRQFKDGKFNDNGGVFSFGKLTVYKDAVGYDGSRLDPPLTKKDVKVILKAAKIYDAEDDANRQQRALAKFLADQAPQLPPATQVDAKKAQGPSEPAKLWKVTVTPGELSLGAAPQGSPVKETPKAKAGDITEGGLVIGHDDKGQPIYYK